MTSKKQSYALTPEEIKKAEDLRENMMMLGQQRANLTLAEADYIRQNRWFWQGVGARLKVDVFSRNGRIKEGRIVLDE